MKKLILILFAVAFGGVTILFIVFNFALAPKKYKNFVLVYSNMFEVDASLVYAIIKVESNFDRFAVSSADARGLMQIMPSTAKWISKELGEEFVVDNLFFEETNIKYGCFYLRYLFSKFATMGAVICAYNAGETVVRSWLDENGEVDEDKISFPETKKYYFKVLGYYNIYKNNEVAQ